MAQGLSSIFYRSTTWRLLRRAALQRDGWRCAVPGCGSAATHVDHIQRRPISATMTEADRIENLRCLCAFHDAQVKERADGTRQRGGRFSVIGSDADGWPLDPRHRR